MMVLVGAGFNLPCTGCKRLCPRIQFSKGQLVEIPLKRGAVGIFYATRRLAGGFASPALSLLGLALGGHGLHGLFNLRFVP